MFESGELDLGYRSLTELGRLARQASRQAPCIGWRTFSVKGDFFGCEE